MTPAQHDRLMRAFPGQEARLFLPMVIRSTPGDADHGAALIMAGTKTATSSAHWHYADGRLPFEGALSLVLDGAGCARGVVETTRTANMSFSAVDADLAWAYGEGERSLDWWRREIGAWYRADAARHGQIFTQDTPLTCEWFAVRQRF